MQTRRDCRVRAKHPQLSGDVPLYRATEQGIQGRDTGGAGRLPQMPLQYAGRPDRRKTLVRITPKGYELCHQCEQALRDYFASVLARLEPEQVAQMDALRGALMDAILAENAARNIDPKGETNHDKDL